MPDEVQLPEDAIKKLAEVGFKKTFSVVAGFARGSLYAISIVFFARLTNFSVDRIEDLLPVRSPDNSYDTLKIGLAFLGGWGSLAWFAFYSLQDLIINILYGISHKSKNR